MAPPYRLIDDATGEVALGPNGEKWEGMDVPPGHTLELYDTTDSSQAWPRVSPSAIVRPGETPPDPAPEPIPPQPPTGAGMDYPKNESEFRQLMQNYRDQNYVGSLDPRTVIDLTAPLQLDVGGNAGYPWGVNGNYAKIIYRSNGGDAILINGIAGSGNVGLTIKNLLIEGGDSANMGGGGAEHCLRVAAPLGDNGSIYRFHLENLFLLGAKSGLMLEGGVFEGEVRGLYIEKCTGDGFAMRHLPNIEGAKNPVVSNILIWHLNSSRNYGAGLRTVYSVNMIGGSFILNGGGGCVAPDGIRYAAACNGENTGGNEQSVFHVPSNGYGSVISGGGEASSDAVSRCRKWTGGEWVDVGKPLLYFVSGDPAVTVNESHVSYYGSGANPMSVRAP
jgi:hypothetical protein